MLDGGAIGGIYDKWHLVPFGEYIPDWLPLPIMVMPGNGFASGPGPRTLHVPGLPPFGALICYEAIFGGEIVDRTDRPAWLVNVTNDAWFGNSTGPRQHLAAARMRAVEEGLPLLRAANTGISAAFDAHGHEIDRVEYADDRHSGGGVAWGAPANFICPFWPLAAGHLGIGCTRVRCYGKTGCSAWLMRIRSFAINAGPSSQILCDIAIFDTAVDNSSVVGLRSG